MKRPVGVILTSIVLGLIAGIQLLSALFGVVAMFGARHLPGAIPGPDGSAVPAVPPGLVMGMMAGYAIFCALLAAWAIVTVVGLVKLRNWGRISVLIIGGCLTACGGLMVFGLAVLALAGFNVPATAALPPHTMRMIFIVEGIMFAGVAAIGVSWLVYFNLRAVKAYFVPVPGYGGYGDPVLAGMIPGGPPPLPGYPPAVYPPAQYLPPHVPGRFSEVPWPVMVLACLFFFSTVSCLVCMLLPFPVFLGGFLLSGGAGHLFYVALAILSGAVGWGLIRLDNRARVTCYVLLVLGTINLAMMMTPWYRARMVEYMLRINESMGIAGSSAAANIYSSGPILAMSAVFGILVYGLVAWVLYHYRAAFVKKQAAAGL